MPRKPSITTALSVLEDFWPEFVEVNGLIFFKSCVPSPGLEFPASWDRTQFEAFHNHIHILDCFSHQASLDEEPYWNLAHHHFEAACQFGRKWIQAVFFKLQSDFPGRAFRVYYTTYDNPIIRFHQVHHNELSWLEYNDSPSAFDSGEIIVLDTRDN